MKKIGFFVVWVCFSACSQYASNGEQLYLKSKNGAELTVPQPLTDSNISRFYDLPEPHKNAQVSIAPPLQG